MIVRFLIFIGVACIFPDASSTAQVVSLRQCIESAIEKNPVVKEAKNELEQTETNIQSARSVRFPSLTAETAGGLSNDYVKGNNYGYGYSEVNMEQLLWQKHKTRFNIEQYKHLKNASGENYNAQLLQLIAEVKIAYYSCQQQQQLYSLSGNNIEKARLFLEFAKEKYRIGNGRKSDVLKAENDLLYAEFESNTFRNNYLKSRNELVSLTLLDSGIHVMVINESFDFIFIPASDSLIQYASRQFPKLIELFELSLSQDQAIRERQSSLFPTLKLSTGYRCSYYSLPGNETNWYSMIGAQWNIFNGFDKRAKIQSAFIQKNILQNRIENMKQFLIKEVSNRILSVREAYDQIILLSGLMKTTGENLEIAKAQYKAGTGSMLELTDARVADLVARQAQINAIAGYKIAVASLEQLTGETYEME